MQADVQKRIQEAERKLSETPHHARQHKVYSPKHLVNLAWSSVSLKSLHFQALVQALQPEGAVFFTELVKVVSMTGTQVSELLSTHEASLGSQVEVQVQKMEQEVARLRGRSAELSQLADIQDHIGFLKVRDFSTDV